MNIFAEVNDRLDIKQVARDLGFQVNRSGFICCPFHAEKTASCRLYENRFYCFGCGEHGDSIDLVSHVKGLSKIDSAKELNSYYQLGVDLGSKRTIVQRKSKAVQKDAGQVKRVIDSIADTIRTARHVGVSDCYLAMLENIHQEMLKDWSLDPDIFKRKWRREIEYHASITRKYNSIISAVQRSTDFGYFAECFHILGRS